MTVARTIRPVSSSDIVAEIERRTSQQVSRCNQCAKCSGGCPAAFAMDLMPRQVMRALQLGLTNEALGSATLWVCLQCHTCSIRCPREIEVARVLEGLRHLALEKRQRPGDRGVVRFHRIFVGLVGWFGRIYEAGLAVALNLSIGRPLQNIEMLPPLVSKGKLPLLPPLPRGASEVRGIMRRVREIEAEERRQTSAEGG